MTTDPVAATRATYDLIADDYAARTRTGTEPRDWLADLTVGLAPGARVLDVGCGPGDDAALLQSRGMHVLGLDLSTAMLALGRAAGVRVVQGDLRHLPVRDHAVDAVWSSASLLHVPREETVATLAEWRRVTCSGGQLSLTTSEGDDEGWELVPYAKPPEGEPDRHRWFVHRTREELLEALAAAGWAVEWVGHRESHRRWHLVRARA